MYNFWDKNRLLSFLAKSAPVSILFSKDYSVYSENDSMTDFGWTHNQWQTDTATFVVDASGNANLAASSSWAGTFTLDEGSAWTDYAVEHEISSITSRVIAGVRASASGTYIVQYIPGSELRLKRSSLDYPTNEVIIANWDSEVPVTQASKIKIQVLGMAITLWLDDVLIGTVNDNTFSTGTISMGAYQTSWGVSKTTVIDVSDTLPKVAYYQPFTDITVGDPVPDWTSSTTFLSNDSGDYSGLVGPYGKVTALNTIVTFDDGDDWENFTFAFASGARQGGEQYNCFRHSASGGYAIKQQSFSNNLTLIKYSGSDPYLNQTLLGTYNNTGHTNLVVTADGSSIKLSDGGVERISVTDSTYSKGTLALKSKNTNNQDIDEIVVTLTE